MAEFVFLVNQNPVLFSIIFLVFLILVLIIVLQKRNIKLPGLEISGSNSENKNVSIKSQISPNITQNPTLNIYSGATISQEQMVELADMVTRRIKDFRQEVGNQPPSRIYKPSIPPEKINYIYFVRHDIESKIKNIVLGHGGPWAGASMASFDTFLDLAKTHHLISEQLAQGINDFYFFTQAMLHSEQINDEHFLEIQYLAAKINRELDYFYKKVGEDTTSLIAQERKYFEEHGEDKIG
jgi:hypothetical protein